MMESGNKILDKEMVELNEMLVKQREQESKPTLDHRLKGFHSGVGYSSGNERVSEIFGIPKTPRKRNWRGRQDEQ